MFAQISPKALFRFCAYTWWRSGHITYHEEKWPIYYGDDGKTVIGFDIEILQVGRYDYAPQVFQKIMQLDQASDCGLAQDFRIWPVTEFCSPEEELQRHLDNYKWAYIEPMFRKRGRDDP